MKEIAKSRKTRTYTEQERKTLCEEWRKSELNRNAFCKKHGVPESTFYTWHSRYFPSLTKKRAKIAGSTSFMPLIPVVKEQLTDNKAIIEITLPNRTVLNVNLTLSQLSQFIQEVSHAAAIIR
jgi:transposase-like protein